MFLIVDSTGTPHNNNSDFVNTSAAFYQLWSRAYKFLARNIELYSVQETCTRKKNL